MHFFKKIRKLDIYFFIFFIDLDPGLFSRHMHFFLKKISIFYNKIIIIKVVKIIYIFDVF